MDWTTTKKISLTWYKSQEKKNNKVREKTMAVDTEKKPCKQKLITTRNTAFQSLSLSYEPHYLLQLPPLYTMKRKCTWWHRSWVVYINWPTAEIWTKMKHNFVIPTAWPNSFHVAPVQHELTNPSFRTAPIKPRAYSSHLNLNTAWFSWITRVFLPFPSNQTHY